MLKTRILVTFIFLFSRFYFSKFFLDLKTKRGKIREILLNIILLSYIKEIVEFDDILAYLIQLLLINFTIYIDHNSWN